MKKILRFLFLPYQQKKLLSQSLFLLCVIRLSLWVFSFRRLNGWLLYLDSFDSTSVDNKSVDWVVIKNVTRAVRSGSRYVPSATCLTQALATRTLLKLRGQNPQLKIGVDTDKDNKFMAHAWIEVDGRIIIGKLPHHQRFTVLNSSPSVIL